MRLVRDRGAWVACLTWCIAALLITGPSLADEWYPPPASRTIISIDGSAKAVESSNGQGGRFVKVYRQSGGSLEALYWQADLINCPNEIFVASGGNNVVTMDTWGRVGSDALVFYGKGGAVLKHYEDAQRDLVTAFESSKIVRSVSSFAWSRDAHAEFSADGSFFWVWLPSGRVMIFEVSTGNAVDATALRLDLGRGRPIVLKTAEMMSSSSILSQRIAAARLAGWLNGQAVLPILRRLAADPYYEDTGQETQAEDSWGRYGDSPFMLLRRVYPVRRAAAEELHIKFGQAIVSGVEESIAY